MKRHEETGMEAAIMRRASRVPTVTSTDELIAPGLGGKGEHNHSHSASATTSGHRSRVTCKANTVTRNTKFLMERHFCYHLSRYLSLYQISL